MLLRFSSTYCCLGLLFIRLFLLDNGLKNGDFCGFPLPLDGCPFVDELHSLVLEDALFFVENSQEIIPLVCALE